MAQKWKNFEKDCVKYLNDTYYKYASFVRNGGENSKQPDIIATTKSGSKIILEVKCPSSQGFQFTLLPNDESKKFIYTAELKENASIHAIKKYMENSYDIYKSTNSAGISIPINDNIFYEHAKNYSFQKNIDFLFLNIKNNLFFFHPIIWNTTFLLHQNIERKIVDLVILDKNTNQI